ncbi:hypothetical protein EVAR_79397_1 [Eumeta japonica]|uniref:Uncharacterized protein n=1 Tax=Eumeta variegata TaxID=151549 RepID=A0A4C1VHQ4_EUMVA|nr:hypothetical protein EVAR_79397_1 [Eumeta japonica]
MTASRGGNGRGAPGVAAAVDPAAVLADIRHQVERSTAPAPAPAPAAPGRAPRRSHGPGVHRNITNKQHESESRFAGRFDEPTAAAVGPAVPHLVSSALRRVQ